MPLALLLLACRPVDRAFPANEVSLVWHVDTAANVPLVDAVFQFYVSRP